MRTLATVQRVLEPLKVSIHAARLKCLSRVVLAALFGSKLALTQLGRALAGDGKTKHLIKRVDVLLGNPHLAGDSDAVQQHLATLMATAAKPVLLIDWTDIGTLWTALVATYVTEGRGLTLSWEVYPQRQKNSAKVESRLLARVATLLPFDAKPILVTDAGFRGPWLEKVRKRGWDFVGRVRGRVGVRSRADVGAWRDVKALWPRARQCPTDLGLFELARYEPVEARLVAVRRKRTKRFKALPAVGRRKKRNIRSAREPLILATSLLTATAKQIADLYAWRWRIELTFRDHKCGRLGLGLDAIRTKKLHRVRAYVLLAVLAHYVAFVLGAQAERAGLAPDFQANTVRNRRVLSWPRLGCEVLRRATHNLLERLFACPLRAVIVGGL